MTALTPRDAKDVETAVRDAIGAGQPLEVVGHGTKRTIGHRSATNALLDVSWVERRDGLRAERVDPHGADGRFTA